MAPTVSRFYGITIIVAFKQKEHNPPHIHAFYGGDEAQFLIKTGELYNAPFPNRGRRLVKEFILKYKSYWRCGELEYIKSCHLLNKL